MKTNASFHISGNHPTRELTAQDIAERDEPVWLVGFQRGYERLEVAVYGHGLCASDAEDAAIEWLEKHYPEALKTDREAEEIHVSRLTP